MIWVYKYLKYVAFAILGAFGIFIGFGLVPLIVWLIDPKSDWVGPSCMLLMLGGMLAYLCYMLGDLFWAAISGRLSTWGLD